MLKEGLPDDIPVVFISSVAQQGLQELKDILWREMNSESNKIAAINTQESLVHAAKTFAYMDELPDDDEGWGDEDIPDDDIEFIDEDEIEDLEDFEYEE